MTPGVQEPALAALVREVMVETRFQLYSGEQALAYEAPSLPPGAWIYNEGTLTNATEIVFPVATANWPIVDGAMLRSSIGDFAFWRLPGIEIGVREQLRFLPGDLTLNLWSRDV